jgi:transcriptional regulator with XRE-family HTH domain
MDLGVLLAEARKRAGLSLRELAAASGTSAPTLHAYEHGTKEPSLSVARRIAHAAGFELDIELSDGAKRELSSNELFKLEIDRLIAERLIVDPETVLGIARRNLARTGAERPVQEQPWVAEREEIIEGPLVDTVRLLLAEDPVSVDLKQAAPFAGVLGEEERTEAMRRV